MNFVVTIIGWLGLGVIVGFVLVRIESTNTCSGPQLWQDLNNSAYSRAEQATSNAICRVRKKLKESN